ncbi:unnamed protein product [Schistocephalus solidus]|uniref:Uncharacterized protein n=1 Tax=Schistocephalus solidus TaxID=70667 RepID=A0A183TML3_SCHSO|nr:unnamed protein product [Schistocephalus solidus]
MVRVRILLEHRDPSVPQHLKVAANREVIGRNHPSHGSIRYVKTQQSASRPAAKKVETLLNCVPVGVRSEGSPRVNIVSKHDGAAIQDVATVVAED